MYDILYEKYLWHSESLHREIECLVINMLEELEKKSLGGQQYLDMSSLFKPARLTNEIAAQAVADLAKSVPGYSAC